MNTQTSRPADTGFLIGLATGAMAGLWTALWLVPHVIADLRRRRDRVADCVVRGAQDVERFATAAKSDAVGE